MHRNSARYRPVIKYAYEVDGVPYQSDALGFGFNDFFGDGVFSSRQNAEAFAAGYRPGEPVTVWYDPQRNSSAVLKPGINKGHIATMMFGILFIGFGVWCLWALLVGRF